MNDETYVELTDGSFEKRSSWENDNPMVAQIELLARKVEKQQKLLDLCLEAVERFGSNHQTSYDSFVQEFNRIKDEPV